MRWFVLLFIWLGAGFVSAENVVLELKNGDRITGKVLQENSTNVTFSTRLLGTLQIPVTEIQTRRVDTNAPPPGIVTPIPSPTAVPMPASPPPPAAPPTPPAAAAPAAPAPTVAAPPTEKKVPAEPSELTKFLKAWQGEVQIGANLSYSTKSRQTYTSRMKATHVAGQMKNVLDYNAAYGRTDGVLSDNRMDGSWKVEYDIGKRFLVYNSIGAGYDEIRQVTFDYDVGPGIGYKLLVSTNYVVRLEMGGNYQEQFYQNRETKRRYSARVAEDFWWQISPKLRFDEKIELFPEIGDFGEFRVRLETNLSYLLLSNLTFTLSVIDLYDSSVPSTVSHNDLQIRSLIGIKF